MKEIGDRWRQRKQDEFIDKCEELDQANHDIQQMVIEASLQKSEMGDQIERMYRKESQSERVHQREMSSKNARIMEESSLYREKVCELENAYRALRQTSEGDPLSAGSIIKNLGTFNSGAEVASHATAFANSMSAEKFNAMRKDL